MTAACVSLVACSDDGTQPNDQGSTSAGTGGQSGVGGDTQSGGGTAGGGDVGGSNVGGDGSPGGAANGGTDAGGQAAGGDSTGGDAGAAGDGGAGDGGAGDGGAGDGGAGDGGAGGDGPGAAAICPEGPFEGSPLPGDNLTATSVCPGYSFSFTEGPVWLDSERFGAVAPQGLLLFSDFQQNGADSNFIGDIVQYTPGGDCQMFIAGTGSNGLATSNDGQLLGARHLDQTITAWDLQTKAESVLVADYMGMAFSSPNDLTVHSNGSVYFTDPAWQVGNRQEVLPQGAYYRDPAGAVQRIEELPRANGITLSPDETLLYVSTQNSVRVYDVDAAGVPSNGRNFVGTGSDGMAVDCAGNLYVTNGGVQVFDPSGTQVGTIQPGGTTNVAFGGAERRTLFITTNNALLSIELNFPGYPY